MSAFNSLPLATAGAAALGVLLIVAGLYVQRRGKLKTRQGAAVLASLAAVVGVFVTGGATTAFILATWQLSRIW